jgi:hypothetical protein
MDRHAGLLAALAGVIVAWFTGVLWIATDKLWRTSGEQISLARRDFEAEHRPWIAIRSSIIPESITVDKDGATVPFTISLENTGRTPAEKLFMWGGAVPHFVRADILTLIATLIKNVKIAKSDFPSMMVFPQEKIEHLTVFGMRFHGKNRNKIFNGCIVYGVFFYKPTFNDVSFYTTFAYAIDVSPSLIRAPDDEGRWPVLPPDKLSIRRWHSGWTAT